MTEAPASLLHICPECRYDLRGVAHERCPECGLDLSFMQAEFSTIPWCDPRRGKIVGFLKTAWMAMARPKLLAREVYRPVDYAAAQRFRWINVLLAFASLLITAGALLVIEPGLWENWRSIAGAWFIYYAAACVLLLLVFISGGHTYFFHPRRLSIEHQNRTLALSYYACAPLCLLPCAAVCLPLCAALPLRNDIELKIFAVLLTMGIAVAAAWLGVLVLASSYARHLFDRGRARWTVGLLSLIALVVSHAICLLVLPAIGLYLALMYYSIWPA